MPGVSRKMLYSSSLALQSVFESGSCVWFKSKELLEQQNKNGFSKLFLVWALWCLRGGELRIFFFHDCRNWPVFLQNVSITHSGSESSIKISGNWAMHSTWGRRTGGCKDTHVAGTQSTGSQAAKPPPTKTQPCSNGGETSWNWQKSPKKLSLFKLTS